MRLAIDLCSGRGGLSKAFVGASWSVLTVDNDPQFNPTICADVRQLTLDDICATLGIESLRPAYEKIVMVMSPPCQRFSIANYRWPKKGIREALEIVGACLELVADIQPDYWLMENPRGRMRWFVPARPLATIRLKGLGYRTAKPTDLWGNIPFSLLPDSPRQRGHNLHPSGKGTLFDKVRDPARRAEMPLGLSKAILEATGGA